MDGFSCSLSRDHSLLKPTSSVNFADKDNLRARKSDKIGDCGGDQKMPCGKEVIKRTRIYDIPSWWEALKHWDSLDVWNTILISFVIRRIDIPKLDKTKGILKARRIVADEWICLEKIMYNLLARAVDNVSGKGGKKGQNTVGQTTGRKKTFWGIGWIHVGNT